MNKFFHTEDDWILLDTLHVHSFQEAEKILQQPQNQVTLKKIFNVLPKFKGKEIDEKNNSLIFDIIYNQNLSYEQQLSILLLNNSNIIDAFFIHHRDNNSLNSKLKHEIVYNNSLRWLLPDFVAYFPLSQSEILFIIKIALEAPMNPDLLRNLIIFQALNASNIDFLLSQRKVPIKHLLIGYQNLNDTWISDMIKDQNVLGDIIESQRLSDYWIKYFLDNELFSDKWHTLFTYQTMSETIIDYILSKNDESLLFLLIKLQPLDIRHKLSVLESKRDSIIEVLLKNQRFTEKEIKLISEQIPTYNKNRFSEFTPNKQIDNNLNRRLKRDHYLDHKLALLRTTKI